MKRLFIALLCLTFAVGLNIDANAQNVEAEKTHLLDKDAKKGYLGSFTYDETAKEYTLVFVREKNKKSVYVTYKYDYDFNKLDEIEEKLSDLDASKKFDFMEFTEEEWRAPSVLRVDGDGFNVNQVTLKKGRITRHWVPAHSETIGQRTYYWPGYWKYNFDVDEKFKPKIAVDLNLDPKTPPAIVKMANKAAQKVKLIAYQSDEPNFQVNTGAMWKDLAGKGKGTMSKSTLRTKNYQEATGSITLLGYQEWYIQKDFNKRYVALNIGVESLEIDNQSLIELDHIYAVVKTKNLPDKSIAAIFAPSGMHKTPAPHSNPREFVYVRVDKAANVIDKVTFESPSSFWRVADITVADNGEVFVYGEASKAKNDKYFDKLGNTSKFDNFQVMKIKDGKVEYITSTGMDEFASKLKIPANMKKVDSYVGKKFEVGPLTMASNGDVFISGQEKDDKGYGNINLFQFDAQGKLRAQYGYKLQETSKEALSKTTVHIEFENFDSKYMNWLVYEMNGSTDSKLLLYPRMAKIDLEKAEVSEFSQYGFEKKEAYYVDNENPIVLIEEGKKVVFFGADKKDKTLWFTRISLEK